MASVAAASISSTSFLATMPASCTVLSGVVELDVARKELWMSELLVFRPLHAAASAAATAFAAAAARAANAGPPRLQIEVQRIYRCKRPLHHAIASYMQLPASSQPNGRASWSWLWW